MFPAKFAYAAPSSLEEAIGLLDTDDAKILAGGHSLLPLMKLRLAQPSLLVDLGRIPGLAYTRRENGTLAIGAMTTYRDIGLSSEVATAAPVLVDCVHEVGDPQVAPKGRWPARWHTPIQRATCRRWRWRSAAPFALSARAASETWTSTASSSTC
jgi:carbon-monoxide dehydrogenase medium subunit